MKQYNVLSGAFSLVNPFLGFFYSLYNILTKKDSCFFFAFSLALITVYFPIMADTSANFYKMYYETNGSQVLDIYEPYIFIPLYFNKNFGVDYYYFIFFNVFFVLYTWSKIVFNTFSFDRVKGGGSVFVIFVILTLTFNYRDLMDINRSIFSYAFIFYYLFLMKSKNIFKMIIFFGLAIWIHSSALIIILIYFLSVLILSYRFNLALLFLSLSIGIFLPNLIFSFESFVTKIPFFGDQVAYYIYGERFGVQVFSIGTFLKKMLNCFIVFVSVYYAALLLKKDKNDRFLQMIIYLGCAELIFFGFVTFFERMNLAFNFLFIYIFSKNVSSFGKIILVFLIFFRSACVYLLIYIPIFFFEHSDVMVNVESKNEMILKVFYYPTPLLLNIHDNGYSDEFIVRNSIWGR